MSCQLDDLPADDWRGKTTATVGGGEKNVNPPAPRLPSAALPFGPKLPGPRSSRRPQIAGVHELQSPLPHLLLVARLAFLTFCCGGGLQQVLAPPLLAFRVE